MKLRYVILARYIEFSERSTLNLIGGDSDKLVAEDYPAPIPALSAAIRLIIEEDELTRPHQVRCRVVPADSDDAIAEGPSIPIPRFEIPADGDRSRKVSVGIPSQVANVLLPHPGEYEFQVLVDGSVMGSAPFRIAPSAFYEQWKAPIPIHQESDHASGGDGDDHDQPQARSRPDREP